MPVVYVPQIDKLYVRCFICHALCNIPPNFRKDQPATHWTKWISLLRSNAYAMRAKATTKNRRRSTAMTKGGTRRRSSFSPTSTPNESVQNTPVQTSRRLSKS